MASYRDQHESFAILCASLCAALDLPLSAIRCMRQTTYRPVFRRLLHAPAVTHHDGLPSERIRGEGSEEKCGLRHVLHHGELPIDGFLEHNVLDDLLFGDAQFLRLLRNLLINEGCAHEARTDNVGTHSMAGPFLGDDLGKANETMLGRVTYGPFDIDASLECTEPI